MKSDIFSEALDSFTRDKFVVYLSGKYPESFVIIPKLTDVKGQRGGFVPSLTISLGGPDSIASVAPANGKSF